MTDLFGALRVPDSDGRIRVSLNKTIVIVIAFLALGWGLGAAIFALRAITSGKDSTLL